MPLSLCTPQLPLSSILHISLFLFLRFQDWFRVYCCCNLKANPVFKQLSNWLHCSRIHFYGVPFLGVSVFFFSFNFQWTSPSHLTHFLLLSVYFSSLFFSAVFLLFSLAHLTRIGLSLRSHLAITAAGSFEHVLSFLSHSPFPFCHFNASVFFEAQAINLCRSVSTKISQFQGKGRGYGWWWEVWVP